MAFVFAPPSPPLSHQHSVQLHARRGGAALPLLLAAHLHPRAARLHAGHRLLSHPLPGGAAVQLSAQAEGAARRGGESIRPMPKRKEINARLW